MQALQRKSFSFHLRSFSMYIRIFSEKRDGRFSIFMGKLMMTSHMMLSDMNLQVSMRFQHFGTMFTLVLQVHMLGFNMSGDI